MTDKSELDGANEDDLTYMGKAWEKYRRTMETAEDFDVAMSHVWAEAVEAAKAEATKKLKKEFSIYQYRQQLSLTYNDIDTMFDDLSVSIPEPKETMAFSPSEETKKASVEFMEQVKSGTIKNPHYQGPKEPRK